MSIRALADSPYVLMVAVPVGALALIGAVVAAAGIDPLAAVGVFVSQTIGTQNGLAEIFVRGIPLTLAGLGIAVAFRARMFNVGADGQIIAGAMAYVAASLAFPSLTGWVLLPLALLAGVAGGAVWGGIAGVLRARANANEIIVTIMLTYIAVQVLGWAIRGPLQESMKVFPRSDAVPGGAVLGVMIEGTRLHWGLAIAAAATIAVFVVLRFSAFGYRIDAVGENPRAARYGGIADRATMAIALTVSGGLAGLAGAVEIAGVHGRLHDAFAEGTGITAIAVALLARLNPLLVPLSAVFFAALGVGASGLQRQLGVPFPLVHIVEGVVILAFLIGTRVRPAARAA